MTIAFMIAAALGWFVAWLLYLRARDAEAQALNARRIARHLHRKQLRQPMSDEDHIALHYARLAADAALAMPANVVPLSRRAPVTEFPRPRGVA